jgi:hypothetical protein
MNTLSDHGVADAVVVELAGQPVVLKRFGPGQGFDPRDESLRRQVPRRAARHGPFRRRGTPHGRFAAPPIRYPDPAGRIDRLLKLRLSRNCSVFRVARQVGSCGCMAVVRIMDPQSGRCVEYERRQPEKSVFYRIVQDHIETVFAEAEQNGSGYPEHVKREFDRFLECGVLAAGFARMQCSQPGCTFERVVAYSCKGRCICPSCVSRRMADCAAHLVDHVLPAAPYQPMDAVASLRCPTAHRLRQGAHCRRSVALLALRFLLAAPAGAQGGYR